MSGERAGRFAERLEAYAAGVVRRRAERHAADRLAALGPGHRAELTDAPGETAVRITRADTDAAGEG